MFQVLIPEAWRMQLSSHLNVLGKVGHSVLIVWRFININEIFTIHTELSWVLLKVSTQTAHIRLQNLGQETEGEHNIFYRGKMREKHKILMNQITIDYKMSKIHVPNKIVTYHELILDFCFVLQEVMVGHRTPRNHEMRHLHCAEKGTNLPMKQPITLDNQLSTSRLPWPSVNNQLTQLLG